MPSSLTAATKLDLVPKMLDKFNSLGSPAVNNGYINNGEGSSFLAIPTKRNYHPRNQNTANSSSPVAGASGAASGLAMAAAQFILPAGTSIGNGNGDAPLSFVDFKSALMPQIKAACYTNSAVTGAANAGPSDFAKYHYETVHIPSQLMPTEQQWCTLNQLRIHAGAPERNERGIEKLMNYYAQLCWLEEKFAFDTDYPLDINFAWFEAFQPKKRTDSTCIQYEKAAVIWNIGALYSQLGGNQSLWTPEGLKLAAQYFQKAAGAFFHVRDSIAPRIMVKVETSSDVSEATLSAIGELMLAQAVECFYLKAEFDNTSSPVTSQIAAQTADYYDIAYKASKSNNSFGKYRFPKQWISHMHVKHVMHFALAHLHCPNFSSADSVVGERQARLKFAVELAEKAVEKANSVDALISAELRVQSNSVLDRIRGVLDQVDKANFDEFHQSQWKRSGLKALRRPPHTLVTPINVVEGDNCGSIADLVTEGIITDLFENVISMMCLGTGNPSPLRRQMQSASRKVSASQQNDSYENNGKRTSLQALSRAMDMPAFAPAGRRTTDPDLFEDGSSLPPYVSEKVKKLVWDIKNAQDQWTKEIDAARDSLNAFDSHTLRFAQELCKKLAAEPRLDNVSDRAEAMLAFYKRCEKTNRAKSTRSMNDSLLKLEHEISIRLSQAHTQLFDGDNVRSKLDRRESDVSDVLKARPLIKKALEIWNAEEPNKRASSESLKSIPLSMSRKDIASLVKEMNEEGYLELFQNSEADPNDLFWSERKITTVVPCLQEEWRSQRKELDKQIKAFWRAYGSSSQQLENSDIVQTLQVLTDVYKQQVALNDEIVDRLDAEMTHLVTFCQRWLSDGKGIVDSLKRVANGQFDASSRSPSPSGESILTGIEIVQGELREAVNRVSQFVHHASAASKDKPNFKLLSQMCADRHDIEQQSEKIITVFTEQLEKWNTWNISIQDAVESLDETRKWIIDTFGGKSNSSSQDVQRDARELSRKTSEQPQYDGSGIVNHNVRGEKIKETIQTLIDHQEQLQNQQISTNWKIADKVIEDANKTFITPFQHAFELDATDQRKRQAMRKLSMAASAIDKVSKNIELTSSRKNSELELAKQRDDLAHKLKLMNQQQREFVKIHNEQMEMFKRLAAAPAAVEYQPDQKPIYYDEPQQYRRVSFVAPARRISLIEKAKGKFRALINSVTERKPSTDATVVINAPVDRSRFVDVTAPTARRVSHTYEPVAHPPIFSGSRKTSNNEFAKRPPPFAPSAPAAEPSGAKQEQVPVVRKKSVVKRRPVDRSVSGPARSSGVEIKAVDPSKEYGLFGSPNKVRDVDEVEYIEYPPKRSHSLKQTPPPKFNSGQQHHNAVPRRPSHRQNSGINETVVHVLNEGEKRMADHLPPFSKKQFKASKTPVHFIDHPGNTRPDSAFFKYDLDERSVLKGGMESVTKYFAWNRDAYLYKKRPDSSSFKRGSLGGDPFIP